MNFNYEYEREKHRQIIALYKSRIPYFSRGIFKVHLSFLAFIVWCVVWAESAVRYYSLDYVDFSPMNPRIYIFPAILLLIGFHLFKPLRVFTEKNYYGVITQVKNVKKLVKSHSAGRRVFYANAPVSKLYIMDSGGKIRKKTVRITGTLTHIYQPNTVVTVIGAESYPLCHDKARYMGKLPCVNCGNLEKPSYNRCFNCRKLLWTKEN